MVLIVGEIGARHGINLDDLTKLKSILLKGDSNMTLEENKLLFDAVQQYNTRFYHEKILICTFVSLVFYVLYVMNNFNVVQTLKMLRRRKCTINILIKENKNKKLLTFSIN